MADPVRRVGERLDLEPVHGDDAEALVQEVVGQRVPGGAEPDDENVLPVVGKGDGAPDVQRVPARQERPDLEAPRHRENVGENPRLGLRDVDRVLRLEDAGLHAVVADPVAGAGEHRIVDADQGQRAEGVPVPAERVHLADLLLERTAGEGNAERIRLHLAVLVPEPLRAGVLVPLLAEKAVERLARHLAARLPAVGQVESVTVTHVRREARPKLRERRVGTGRRDEGVEPERLRQGERGPVPRPLAESGIDAKEADVRVERLRPRGEERGVALGERQLRPRGRGAKRRRPFPRRLGRERGVLSPRNGERRGEVEEHSAGARDAELFVRGPLPEEGDERGAAAEDGGPVERRERRLVRELFRDPLLEDREAETEEDGFLARPGKERLALGGDAEEFGDEARQLPRRLDEKDREVHGGKRFAGTVALEACGKGRSRRLQAFPEELVEVVEARGVVEVGIGETEVHHCSLASGWGGAEA